MPIRNWNVDPDLRDNEDQMISKFSGTYRQERKHWSDSDKRAITHEPTIQRVKSAFLKVPTTFDMYFWQSTNPNYDPTMNIGPVKEEWIKDMMGEKVWGRIAANHTPDVITVIFTNNLSDIDKINLRSPWMIAHRLGHCFLTAKSHEHEAIFDAAHYFENFVEKITSYAYGTIWPSKRDYSYFGTMQRDEWQEIYQKILGPHLGTMASARNNRLATPYEWYVETFTQWMIKGKITLKELPPEIHPDEKLTTDEKKLAHAQKAWANFPRLMGSKFNKILNSAKGEIWVV